MKRLLCVVTNMNTGGAETFLMKIYRQLDLTKYQMDFCICNLQKNFYEDEIKKLGGKIYHLPLKTKHPFSYIYQYCKLLKQNKYTHILRLGSTIFETPDLYIAWLLGVKTRVFRSCNANSTHCSLLRSLHKILRCIVMFIANVKIAPSDLAAQFTFGNTKNVHILPNGLDIQSFSFSTQVRQKIRQDLNVQDKFVIGHIGRFNFQKNHKFLLEIFAQIKKQRKNAVLWLVGKGELEEDIKSQIAKMDLQNSVEFLGVRSDIPALLSAMDVFVFPSLFEGMPNTVIEAQTNGLPCLIADTITKQAKQTDLVHFMSLNQSAKEWAEEILQFDTIKTLENRFKATIQMRKSGYDIKDTAKQFVSLVFKKGGV